MRELFEKLELKKNILSGRVASESEITLLFGNFPSFSALQDFLDLIRKYKIIGQYFNLSTNDDLSGMGMRMKWLTPNQQIEEAYESYPGKIVIGHNYLPIGMCLAGSGDPYFLKEENSRMNVYRVLHDLSIDDLYRDDMVEFIIPLEELILKVG